MTSANPKSRSSAGSQPIRTPVIACGLYRTMPPQVSTPSTTSWKPSTTAYVAQNNRRPTNRTRKTHQSSATARATAASAETE